MVRASRSISGQAPARATPGEHAAGERRGRRPATSTDGPDAVGLQRGHRVRRSGPLGSHRGRRPGELHQQRPHRRLHRVHERAPRRPLIPQRPIRGPRRTQRVPSRPEAARDSSPHRRAATDLRQIPPPWSPSGHQGDQDSLVGVCSVLSSSRHRTVVGQTPDPRGLAPLRRRGRSGSVVASSGPHPQALRSL
jgi:hypothetical protein